MQGFEQLFIRDEAGRWRVSPRAPFFTSEASARWWIRQHGSSAVRAGALVQHCGRWHFVPDLLASVVEKVGRQAALARLRRHKDRLSVARHDAEGA